ncbi:uncharacterized protein LOC129752593 [Uranotaenia lowii]|uniref:uncharacterized protein LOC129752593 n=1 Tax=Uranotaenia lowii TaxID=190385 RepID=UPI00247B2C2D|nr:uncharacterized protein LOC129752593 [Uranotaenia lowii]
MNNMESLLRKRTAIEGRLRRAEQRIEALNPEGTALEHLKAELECLQDLLVDFRAIQNHILDQCIAVDDIEEHLDEEESIIKRFNASKAKLNGGISKLLAPMEQPKDTKQEDSGSNDAESFGTEEEGRDSSILAPEAPAVGANFIQESSDGGGATQIRSHVRLTAPELHLPKGILPTFTGEYSEWSSFFDLFLSAVDKNENLSKAQKLFYLKTYTSGKAAAVIKHVRVEDSAYDGALEALKRRFDRKDLIVAHHVQRFIEIPSFTVATGLLLRRLHDTADDVTRALAALRREERDCWLIHLLLMKVDVETRQHWIDRTAIFEFPASVEEFLGFIDQRAYALETAHNSSFRSGGAPHRPSGNPPHRPSSGRFDRSQQRSQSFISTGIGASAKCNVCQQKPHYLLFCQKFRSMSSAERLQTVHRMDLCTNCLRVKHGVATCDAGRCRKCNEAHHTLLHDSLVPAQVHLSFGTVNHVASDSFSSVFLATAIIWVTSASGERISARALLDSGSQASFVTTKLVEQLQPETHRIDIPLKGISGMSTKLRKAAFVNIGSRHSNLQMTLECAILDKISDQLPHRQFDIDSWKLNTSIPLADEHFNKPASIDLLIGAGVFYQLLEGGRISLGPSKPVLQQTVLGWVVAGECRTEAASNKPSLCLMTSLSDDEAEPEPTVNQLVSRFWELETLVPQRHLSVEERLCEDHYRQHTTRDHTGRYVVKLPFKRDPVEIAETGYQALKQFDLLKKRLNKDPERQKMYEEYINNFIIAGHISRAEPSTKQQRTIFLPHHCVLKEDRTTTKLRVVFNGSMKSSNGVTLNDLLMTGPVVQKSLYCILLNFRTHRVALTGDIEKMYLQVRVSPEDSDRIRMIWQEPGRKVAEYRMNTVTFGLACAPFLATRTLKQLFIDEGNEFPIAKESENDIYVDDCLTGADTVEEAIEKRMQLTRLLQKGFPIRKWASNESSVLRAVPPNDRASELALDLEPDPTIKTLGLKWQCRSDLFVFVANCDPFQAVFTKRQVLSTIAKIFDPLGLIGPVVTIAKVFMQEIWKIASDWSDPLPASFNQRWRTYLTHLREVWRIKVPRRSISIDKPTRIYLHGFCDASELAYGAVIYLRAIDKYGNTSSRLLCSKSKVCPINRPTIPRSELCAAALLAELIKTVKQNLRLEINQTLAFSDSMTTLAWIAGDPSRWKTFVANRVVQINEILPAINWRHVRTHQNPADLLSRGAAPVSLAENHLWWSGPDWEPESLREPQEVHLAPKEKEAMDNEKRRSAEVASYYMVASDLLDDIIARYSSYRTMVRVTSWMIRFVVNIQLPREHRNTGPLSVGDYEAGERMLVRYSQHQAFDAEITALQQGEPLPHKSKLWPLTPFLDGGLLRVGGRLARADMIYESKHPWILPAGCRLAKVLFHQEHVKNHHIGAQALLAFTRRRFWVPNGRNLARNTVWSCIPCYRKSPERGLTQPIMGQLPPERVNQAPPFFNSGVDYGGPITLVDRRGRGATSTKGYIAIFVCYATRAVHIEAVTKLTTTACLAALRRFIGRRGAVGHLYSDNGTNFQGASREMRAWYKKIQSDDHNQRVANFLSAGGTQWHFNVPGVPHLGGLWEAAIKTAKHHLNIVTGNARLTFEEFTTLLIEIEAIMNSRPISPCSNDPNDLQALTPGHLLIGRPIKEQNENGNYLPNPDVPYDLRFRYIMELKNHFWERWHREYIPELQIKGKWQKPSNEIIPGDLVLIRSKNLLSTQWRLGRVLKLHDSPDGHPRLATVRVQSGEITQTIHNISKLPTTERENS